ncbi:MAG: hypothetical protein J2P26_09960 [Nocardiopsaceae bacterium]|nr:hypothetical protein [Nocardiopsaceae bacterium]
MIEVELPSLEYRDLPLAGTDGVRGDDEPGREPLLGRVQVGGPHLRRLRARDLAADPEVSRYADRTRYEYYLMYLGVSFPAHGSPRLKAAQVAVALRSVPDAIAPAALSMRPLSDGDQVSVRRTASLGPKLTLLDAVDAEAGSIEVAQTRHRTEVFLRAVGLAGASPRWEFTETAGRKLDGAFPLLMVIQAGRGTDLSVTGTVSAQAKGNIPWRYRGDLPGPLEFGGTP